MAKEAQVDLKCEVCDKEIPKNSSFCLYCGAKIIGETDEEKIERLCNAWMNEYNNLVEVLHSIQEKTVGFNYKESLALYDEAEKKIQKYKRLFSAIKSNFEREELLRKLSEFEEIIKEGQKIFNEKQEESKSQKPMAGFICPYCEKRFDFIPSKTGEGKLVCVQCNKEIHYIVGIARGMKGSITRIVTYGPSPFSVRLKTATLEEEIRFSSYCMIDVSAGDKIIFAFKKGGILVKKWENEPTILINYTTNWSTNLKKPRLI